MWVGDGVSINFHLNCFQVGRYVELAQDSLRACYDGATLGTARWDSQPQRSS